MIVLLKWNCAVNSRGAITMIIVVHDGKCIGLSSIVDLICIDEPTMFALIFDEHIVFFRQDCNRLLEVIEAWRITHVLKWMSLLKMTLHFQWKSGQKVHRMGDIGAFLEI